MLPFAAGVQHLIDKEFDGKRGRWAYAESPLIDGDVLVCTPGGNKATLVALNKKDGSLIWKAAVAKGNEAAYSSPIVAEVGGVPCFPAVASLPEPPDLAVLAVPPMTVVATAEALAKQWALAGINATIDPLTLAGALQLLESGNFQGVVAGYPAQQDTPLTLATSLVCPVLFSPGFCDQSVTSEVKQALETQKFNLQATLMKRAITQAVVADASYVPLNSTPFGIFLTKSTHGFGFYGGEIYLAGVSLS